MDLTDRVFTFLERFNKPASTHSFGLFRMLFSLHILLIISDVFKLRELIFDAIPEVSKNVFPALLYLFIWTIAVLFLFAGYLTRYAALVNYICVVLATSIFTSSNVGTFNDDLLRMGSFLCLFMPVSGSFSIDRLLKGMQLQLMPKQQTRYVNYLLFLFLTLGILYFPSGITKTYSPMWVKGLGLWIPSNIPHNKWNELPNLIVNQAWLMYFVNYAVIVWEVVFVFLLFIPRLHPYIVIPGVLFHLGIASMFPFPLVCTGPITFYTLFIPTRFWEYLSSKFKSKSTQTLVIDFSQTNGVRAARLISAFDIRHRFSFQDGNDGVPNMKKIQHALGAYWIYKPIAGFLSISFVSTVCKNLLNTLTHEQFNQGSVSWLTVKAKQTLLVYFTIACLVMQLGISSYHAYSHYHTSEQKRMAYMLLRKSGYDLSMKPTNLMRTFLGINSRGLFLDHANTGQKTTYALTYFKDGKELWLPMMDERGYVKQELNMNLAWAKVNFNLIAFSTNPADSIGLKKLTKFWARKDHISLDSLHVMVYKKTYTYPTEFEKDYYLKLEHQPWEIEGEIWWKHGIFSYYPLRKDTIR